MKEAAVGISSSKKVFLNILQNSQENTCDGVFFKCSCSLEVFFIIKGTPAQVFSSEVCEILGTSFYMTSPVTASEM